jgi:hypothetical protein
VSLQKVEIYSSSQLTSTLLVDDSGPIEADYVQVLNIDGLDPVTATIDVVTSGNVDGAVAMDAAVPTRNIVLTIRPNPDWVTWTAEQLRQFIYNYFVPKSLVRLYFTSDEISGEVWIEGVVESCGANPFTKDPTYLISIVCADPYFMASDPVVVDGAIINPANWPTSKSTISNPGNVPIGMILTVADGYDNELYIQAQNPAVGTFHLIGSVAGILYMGSIPTKKYLRSGDPANGTFTNRLYELQPGSVWPVLAPGDNDFAVMNAYNVGVTWELSFYPKYAGL